MNMDILLAAAARPRPFEPSALNIWTDPWIAKGMLAAHLDDSTDAASRGPEQRARALEWLGGFLPPAGGRILRPSAAGREEGFYARRRGRVLDLGCGPGLYAEELAARGCEVTGVDLSRSSVDYARSSASSKGLEIDYRCGNYLTDDLGGGYALAMMIYCDFGALAPGNALVLLDRAREALAPGGIFAFDILGPGYAASAKPRKEWRASAGPSFWSPRPCLVLEESFVYPEERCTANQCLVLAEGEDLRAYRTWDRWFGEDELVAMLAGRGLEAIGIRKGLVAENDFGSAEVLFVAARRRD